MSEQYTSYKYTGYVYDIAEEKFGIEIKCRTVKDESDIKHPQHIMFCVGAKSKHYKEVSSLGIGIDDRIEIEFMPSLFEGTGKTTNKPFAINKNNITSAKIVEKAAPVSTAENLEECDDIPF